MPQVKQEDGTYREIAFAINAKTRKMIEEAVIDEYKKVAAKPVLGTRH
jgi:DNA-binding cell septation regulator SpoVG